MLEAIEADWRGAGLSAQRTAMLTYVEKLTLSPGEMTQEDVTAVQDAGFSDRDILDICTVAAYYAYVNRIADGLGVQLESWQSSLQGGQTSAAS